jgi:hypothetical protein
VEEANSNRAKDFNAVTKIFLVGFADSRRMEGVAGVTKPTGLACAKLRGLNS